MLQQAGCSLTADVCHRLIAGTFSGVNLFFERGIGTLVGNKGYLNGVGNATGSAVRCTGQGQALVSSQSVPSAGCLWDCILCNVKTMVWLGGAWLVLDGWDCRAALQGVSDLISRTIEGSVYETAEADLTSLLQYSHETNAAIDMVVLLNAKSLDDKL